MKSLVNMEVYFIQLFMKPVDEDGEEFVRILLFITAK